MALSRVLLGMLDKFKKDFLLDSLDTPKAFEYLVNYLGQFTRNYTQTTKRGLLTTNKG